MMKLLALQDEYAASFSLVMVPHNELYALVRKRKQDYGFYVEYCIEAYSIHKMCLNRV